MTNLLRYLTLLAVVAAFSVPPVPGEAYEGGNHLPEESQLGNTERIGVSEEEAQLSDRQVSELEKLHKEMVRLRKQIIDKYVELGLLSEQDAEKIKKRIDIRYEKMKEDRFLPKWKWKKEKGREDPGTVPPDSGKETE
jgi:Protein of unknown function (DUF2680).